MVGEEITIVRERSITSAVLGQVTQSLTYEGVILDTRYKGDALTEVYVSGLRQDGKPVRRWFAVGPDAMRGTLTRQAATLARCGHDVTDGCDCDPAHTCGSGINFGCEHPECDGNVGD